METLKEESSKPPRTYFDVQKVREDFPVFRNTVKGKSLVYIDNAATSQKPPTVVDAVARYYGQACSSVHRGLHSLSERSTELYEGSRTKVQHFIRCWASRVKPDRIRQ